MRDYTVSIVIPVYKNWELCDSVLAGLYKNELSNIDEVVIVDDFSEDVSLNEVFIHWKNLLPLTVIKNAINSGFTISANNGLRYCDKPIASKHITFLISSDVTITGKFIERTADILLGARKSLVGGKLLFGNTGWNEFDGKVFQYLEGWFLACTSDGWRELGYLDENYAPFDYEDIDISTTAKKLGYKLEPLNSPFLKHKGGGSIGYNPAREAITKRNREYFRKKWLGE